ncbi:MAG: peroxide stress protein YaaA [Paludibacter sp.]|nr:peroxide stress protein YaaA [Paludibacter sp.]
MLIILSPTKIQNFKDKSVTAQHSLPENIHESQKLVKLIRKLSPAELGKLLDINNQLTQLNFDRFFNWHFPFTLQNAKQAVLVFDGEVFRGLNAKSFSEEDFEYAQQHLRILSGLYGILKPLDLIQPYRLEVSSKLVNDKGKDLYAFWENSITKSIDKAIKASGEPQVLINLASDEYFKSINSKLLKHKKIIHIEFWQYKDDKYKQIVIYTKKARGLMASFIIKNKIEDVEMLKGFAEDRYWYSPQMSTEKKLVFIR